MNDRRPITTSPSASWLVSRSGVEDPLEAIRRLVRELLDASDACTVPVALEKLFRPRRIVGFREDDIGCDGLLEPLDTGFLIKIKRGLASASLGRTRYTIAHEIAHTFFFDLRTSPPKRPYLPATNDRTEEMLCEKAAAEILMPRNVFAGRLKTDKVSIRSLLTLATEFQTSIQATAIRIAGLKSNYVFLIWKFMGKEADSENTRLRVQWACGPDRLFIPREASNSKGTMKTIVDAFEHGGRTEGFERFVLGDIVGDLHAESLRLSDRFNLGGNCVLSVIELNPQIQLRL